MTVSKAGPVPVAVTLVLPIAFALAFPIQSSVAGTSSEILLTSIPCRVAFGIHGFYFIACSLLMELMFGNMRKDPLMGGKESAGPMPDENPLLLIQCFCGVFMFTSGFAIFLMALEDEIPRWALFVPIASVVYNLRNHVVYYYMGHLYLPVGNLKPVKFLIQDAIPIYPCTAIYAYSYLTCKPGEQAPVDGLLLFASIAFVPVTLCLFALVAWIAAPKTTAATVSSTCVMVGGSELPIDVENARVVGYAISPPFPGCTKQQVVDWFATPANWQTINVNGYKGKATVTEPRADGSFDILCEPKSETMLVSNLRTYTSPEVDIMLTVTSPYAPGGMAFDVLFQVSEGPAPVVTRRICNTRGMGGIASCCGGMLAAAVIKPVMTKEYAQSIEKLCKSAQA